MSLPNMSLVPLHQQSCKETTCKMLKVYYSFYSAASAYILDLHISFCIAIYHAVRVVLAFVLVIFLLCTVFFFERSSKVRFLRDAEGKEERNFVISLPMFV